MTPHPRQWVWYISTGNCYYCRAASGRGVTPLRLGWAQGERMVIFACGHIVVRKSLE